MKNTEIKAKNDLDLLRFIDDIVDDMTQKKNHLESQSQLTQARLKEAEVSLGTVKTFRADLVLRMMNTLSHRRFCKILGIKPCVL